MPVEKSKPQCYHTVITVILTDYGDFYHLNHVPITVIIFLST